MPQTVGIMEYNYFFPLNGPSLSPDLVEEMISFRRWPISLTADVTKDFLQLFVKRRDRDGHCSLLRDEDATKYMKFPRCPFGNVDRPFLKNATIKHRLEGRGHMACAKTGAPTRLVSMPALPITIISRKDLSTS